VYRDLGVVIYHRWGNGSDGQLERFIVALNFSDTDRWVDIPFSTNGTWTDVLNGGSVAVQNWRIGGAQLPSNWGKVFWQRE